jgi:FkbM family methyltransferase
MARLRKHFYKLLYRLGVITPYWEIERYRYLKRVTGCRRLDWRYAQEADLQQFGSSEVVIRCSQFPSPVLFYCDPRSKIEQDIIKDKGYQPHISDLLFDYFRDEIVFLDVGANIGYFSIVAAKQFPRMLVHAFEPNQSVYARLQRNIGLNQNPVNLEVFPIALSNFSGNTTLYTPSPKDFNQGLSSLGADIDGVTNDLSHTVPVAQIDEIYENSTQAISVIKIDVQGFEPEVLKGGERTIRRFRPVIVLEHNDDLFKSTSDARLKKHALKAFFEGLGYRVLYVSLYGSSLLAPVRWERPLNGDLLALP